MIKIKSAGDTEKPTVVTLGGGPARVEVRFCFLLTMSSCARLLYQVSGFCFSDFFSPFIFVI
jgi:hypothetical protein